MLINVTTEPAAEDRQAEQNKDSGGSTGGVNETDLRGENVDADS